MSLRRFAHLLLLVPCAVGPAGCCSLARAFCGPDTSAWVPISHESPQATLRTFLEAIRRDNPDQVLHCLAESYKETHGLNSVAIQVAWERLREQVPYLHLAGYLAVPDRPQSATEGRCRYELDADGRRFTIDLVRQSFTQIVYELPDGTLVDAGRALPRDHWGEAARVTPKGFDDDSNPQSEVALAPMRVVHPRYGELPPDRLRLVAIGREWKIADLTLPQ